MPVFNASGLVQNPWISPEEEPPTAVPVGVTARELTRLNNGGERLNTKRYGLSITSVTEIDSFIAELPKLELIVIRSINFKDGRVFSLSRLIRHRHGFANELRLQGDFIPDQIPFLVRCGFDSFEVGENFDIAPALKLLTLFPYDYQRLNKKRSVISLRHPTSGKGVNSAP